MAAQTARALTASLSAGITVLHPEDAGLDDLIARNGVVLGAGARAAQQRRPRSPGTRRKMLRPV